ncbi:hypothetical protein ACROYT_G005111 [Oculina patagonica]
MALKVSLILAVYFLCGFLAVIQPAYSIRCNRNVVISNDVLNDDGVVECRGEGVDRCRALTYTLDSTINVMINKCMTSAIDCDQDAVCERIRTRVENHGGTLSDCSSSCCNSDNCNAPADKKSKVFKMHGTRGGNNIKEKLAKLISSRI